MGNIGFSTLEALLAEGHDVVAFDLESRRAQKLSSSLDSRGEVIWGDVTDPESLEGALDGVRAVIHLAAIIPPYTDRAPDLARRVNVDATRNLIALMEASPTCEQAIIRGCSGAFCAWRR
jgi:nucleoside-diphosphate-sugar epimerase